MPANQTEPQPSKPAILLRRTLSSVLLWAVVLVAIFSDSKLVSDYVFLLIMLRPRRELGWLSSTIW